MVLGVDDRTVAASSAAFPESSRAPWELRSVSRKAPMAPKYDSCRRNRGCTSPLDHVFIVNVSVRTAIWFPRRNPPVKNTLGVL